MMKPIQPYSFGMGDRFGKEADAQLSAIIRASEAGIDLVPVWNKSHREHGQTGTRPTSLGEAARHAIEANQWAQDYHIDADHIRLDTVEEFVDCSDFFTLDVANKIGVPASAEAQTNFRQQMANEGGEFYVPGLAEPICWDETALNAGIATFLGAVEEAARIHRLITDRQPNGDFIIELSIDETESPQTRLDLYFVLAMTAFFEIPIQTIAPKFTGRFNKGVDYVGDVAHFSEEFKAAICIVEHAKRTLNLPQTLKLSLHSGSDKFSIYPVINELLRKHGCGLHVKTAGTTWLEELIGLAESGGDGLAIVKEIYAEALDHFDELTTPYSTVLDINWANLPSSDETANWNGRRWSEAMTHDAGCPAYSPDLRQLMHVSYKLAAGMEGRFYEALVANREIIAARVTANLFDKHIRPIFFGVTQRP